MLKPATYLSCELSLSRIPPRKSLVRFPIPTHPVSPHLSKGAVSEGL